MNKTQPLDATGLIAEQAQRQYKAQHYKDAIVLYKKLWQQSGDDMWQQYIARCYQLRAFSFADRGMIKEALQLWDNYMQFNLQPVTAYDRYVGWILLTKDPVRIEAVLKQLTTDQVDRQYPALSTVLGVLTITEQPGLKAFLPTESCLVKDIDCIQSALQAYQQGDFQQTRNLLKQLPYRSVFRDLRNLLKACILPAEEINTFDSLLTRIPNRSLYAAAAKMLKAACRDKGQKFVNALPQFSCEQARQLIQLKGFDKKKSDFILTLAKKDKLTSKEQFDLVIQYKSLFDLASARRFCQLVLSGSPADGLCSQHFTNVNDLETTRLQALKEERNQNFHAATIYWRRYIQQLNKKATGGEDNQLKIALILRHLAEKVDLEEKIDFLTESLDYDCSDFDSYLNIIKSHQILNNEEQYLQWLEKTSALFPQRVEILSLAVEAAQTKKAYKKATLLAQKILKIDPINRFAKQYLFYSHLEHARQLISDGKFYGVENEIQQTKKLRTNKTQRLQVDLILGLSVFAAGDTKRGWQIIMDSLVKLYPQPVNQYFWLTIEAILTRQEVAILLKKLPAIDQNPVTESALDTLVEQINQIIKEEEKLTTAGKALDELKLVLKNSIANQIYTEKSLLLFADALLKLNQFDLLLFCSKRAIESPRLYTRCPIWNFYKIYAEVQGKPEKCQPGQISALNFQKNQAINSKDQQTVRLISEFIELYLQENPVPGLHFLTKLLNA